MNRECYSADESKDPDKFDKLMKRKSRLEHTLRSDLNGERHLFKSMLINNNRRMLQLSGIIPTCKRPAEKIAARTRRAYIRQLKMENEWISFDDEGLMSFYSLKGKKGPSPEVDSEAEKACETDEQQELRLCRMLDEIHNDIEQAIDAVWDMVAAEHSLNDYVERADELWERIDVSAADTSETSLSLITEAGEKVTTLPTMKFEPFAVISPDRTGNCSQCTDDEQYSLDQRDYA